MALEAGMVLSNEPGYYQTGDWGIRIENLIVVTPAKQTGFLEFETLTLCPLDRRLIDKTRLDVGEIGWIDHYHRAVYEQLQLHLSPMAKSWSEAACRPL